jgi:hypothetical protein
MKQDENSCTVSSGALFKFLYYVSNCNGFFFSFHLEMNDVSNVAKLGMLLKILGQLRGGGVNQLFISLNNFMPFKQLLRFLHVSSTNHIAYGQ